MSLPSSLIAEQNDRFRSMLQIPQFGQPELRGQVVVTPGISALSPLRQIAILAEVRNFSAFSEDNDPYGEHDFGAFDHPGVGKIFWKIDYYDADYRFHSPDPADPKATRRVLTIMLAEEY